MKKIEIDLEDILGSEFESETMQESIRRQVIETITKSTAKAVEIRINEAVAATIQSCLKDYLAAELPNLFAQLMDAEYTPVSQYGAKDKPTTLRATLLKSVTDNMVYRRQNYSSDNNTFTKAVDAILEDQMKQFKADFNKTVDSTFTAAAFDYAKTELTKKLGVR